MKSMQVGQAIRQGRRAAGLTQAQLAEAAGFRSRTTIVAIEQGERGVSDEEIERLQSVIDRALANVAAPRERAVTSLERTCALPRQSLSSLRSAAAVIVEDLERDARQAIAVATFLRKRFDLPTDTDG